MHIAPPRIYPVKSLAGGQHDAARVCPWGLDGDRRWMVVTPEGRFLTQRQHPRMALVGASGIDTGLRLSARSGAVLDVAWPGEQAPTMTVTVWKDTVPARAAGAEADAWLSGAVGVECRLVYLHDPKARKIDPGFAGPEETVNLSDGFPLLLVSAASLADLNARLAAPVPAGRFRPNLIVEGAEAWEEDGWRLIRVGEATFSVVKPCERCIVTTIDPETGERPDRLEPLKTLATFRRDARGLIMFGQNLIPRTLGVVRAGDTIEVIERGATNVAFAPAGSAAAA